MTHVCAILLISFGALTTPVAAAPTPEQIKDVAHDLVCLCDTCNRESLSTCQCGFATAERETIGEMLVAGQSRQQIVDSYVDRFGSMGLANPPEGYDVVWIVPFVMLGVGVLGVRQVLVYWRRGRPVAAASVTPTAAPGAYGDRLRDDLDSFEA
ncbi:MAG TPA: hypothetical protein DIC52_00425 [Candidatus Latescibacteria bacterium]|jgi:cytochrome c-type biogenesis protein CcmH/NrfF|nr:hypothetical protein [Candidatus Latescibacterota bacterium]|tara:strand:- start:696 stop:1157 length:462 start_codon:yes stop_codon:yes gene_type:complete